MKTNLKKKNSNGLTLMEMIIAISILAVLAVIAIPSVSGYLRQGKITQASADAAQLASAINIYNVTLNPPLDGTVLSDASKSADLERELADAGLLPNFSGNFAAVLKNVYYDATSKFFGVKDQADIDIGSY